MSYNFRDNPNTQTDDYLAKAAAINDLISTLTGGIVAVVSVLTPIIISFFPNVDSNVKLAAWTGVLGTGAGAIIARQQPKSLQEMASDRLKQQSQSSEEEKF
ncbi:hypothetical protein [Nostoc parmelioides]|uniref:Holin n=1 Tax=Nostoc parmelioides FACHB-3921 TaxID=2692909 RepID=A0ABR8BLA7_9NOSO|nr:hypothetical protein [Nostoc parmelioides]MBD2254439.1 hypothetical protein [Nostoc parmelioides FACHB-3921]